MNTISKKIFLISFALFIAVGCIKTKKQDRSGLESLVLNNAANGAVNDKYTNGSLVILSRADLASQSFTGECYDTFTMYGGIISPTNYYNTIPGGGGGLLNTDLKKYAVSTSNCTALSFTGTTSTGFGSATQRPDHSQDFNFKMYSCDPNNNPCSRLAITAAGF